MNVFFTTDGWADFCSWAGTETQRRVIELIEDARRHPFTGLGKPEALKGSLAGWWSRRITAEHRLVYRVRGKAGEDQRLEVIQCRYHY